MRLHPNALVAGVLLATYERIGSTNAEALARARAGEEGPLWITAREQSAGRGRHGRGWVSEPGNLYASLLLTDPAPVHRAPELAFVSGLAVHDAVAAAAPDLRGRLTLKWPNDLLCDGAKLAGILIEGEGAHPFATVIGIGINCRHHPEATAYPATDLAALGHDVTADDLFFLLSRTMPARLAQWDRGAGFPAIRADWLDRTAERGQAVGVRIGTREVSGSFEGLDASGRLLLRRHDGVVETISAGDVFPMMPAAATA